MTHACHAMAPATTRLGRLSGSVLSGSASHTGRRLSAAEIRRQRRHACARIYTAQKSMHMSMRKSARMSVHTRTCGAGGALGRRDQAAAAAARDSTQRCACVVRARARAFCVRTCVREHVRACIGQYTCLHMPLHMSMQMSMACL